jgi:predicted ATP-grasp superfamily ATP-dependent carboligase
MRVFVYEFISAGGLGTDAPASLLREGRAMRDAVSDDFRRMPGVEVVTEASDFRATAASCDWTLVIAPEFDDLLRDLSQAVLDVGGRLLGSLPAAIELTADKLAMARFWHEREVAHPSTGSVDCDIAPPLVIKPRHGAGSQATYLVRDRTLLNSSISHARREWNRGELIRQKYVVGQPASVALIVGQHQTVALLPASQTLSRDDRLQYLGGTLPLPPEFAKRAVAIALQTVAGIDGLRGYVGVDLVLGDNGDYAIEINPRLTTSYLGLRQLCRGNLAELILRCARDEHLEPPIWDEGEFVFAP